MDIKTKLSTLWLVVMLNLIFADILSITMELLEDGIIDIIGPDVSFTMAIAAILINIPIFMIYLSRKLSDKTNRLVNIVAAIITIIFVIGGGSWLPHYLIIASVEVVVLLLIIYTAFRWKQPTPDISLKT